MRKLPELDSSVPVAIASRSFPCALFLLLLAPLCQAQDKSAYSEIARDWVETTYSVFVAVSMITYADDAALREKGLNNLESVAMRGSSQPSTQFSLTN